MQHTDVQEFRAGRSGETVSEVLRGDIEEFVNELRQTNRLLASARLGTLSLDAIGRYLRSIHYLLRHTPVHLSLAEEEARHRGHLELADYFARKSAEEVGHDQWAEADMAALSKRFGVTLPADPCATIVTTVKANANTILENPLLYLVYILFAEYSIVLIGPEWIGALEKHCGVPASMMTAVGNHAELDKEHVVEGSADIDAFLDGRSLEPARESLRGVMLRFAAFCDELCDEHSSS